MVDNQLTVILQKIKNHVGLTPSELSYYSSIRKTQPNLPPPTSSIASEVGGNGKVYAQTGGPIRVAGTTNQTQAPSSWAADRNAAVGNPSHTFGYNDQDRGSNPSYNAGVSTPGASADSVWALERNAAVGNPGSGGYAPTLDQEQSQYQHNANQGGNPSAVGWGHVPDYFPGDQSAPGSADADPNSPGFQIKLPDVQMPNVPNVQLSWHDFTKQAQQKVAGAYAPLYSAIKGAKSNATTQASDSRAIIAGMYDDLAKSNTQDKTDTTNQYNTDIAAAKKEADTTKATQQGAMGSAEDDLAKLLATSGVSQQSGSAASDILAQSVGEKSAAGTAADTQAREAQGSITAQKNNQLDFETNVGSADKSAGIAEGGRVVSDLANVLQQYDQQNLSTKADEAQQGLSLNQQMSQNDWQAQQGSADQTWNAYNAAMGQAQAEIGINQANATLNNQAAAAAAAAQTAAAQVQEQRYEFDTNTAAANAKQLADQKAAEATLAQQQTKNAADERIAQQKADQLGQKKQGTDKTATNYDPTLDPTAPEYLKLHNPYNIYKTTLAGLAGDEQTATTLDGVMRQVIKNLHGDKGAYINQYQFADAVAHDAAAFKIPEGLARAAAVAFQKSLGSQQSVNPQPQYQKY